MIAGAGSAFCSPAHIHMRGEFREFLTRKHDQEEFEDLIDSYEAMLDQPVSRH